MELVGMMLIMFGSIALGWFLRQALYEHEEKIRADLTKR